MLKKLATAATIVALSAGVASAKDQFGILGGAMQGDTYYDVKLASVSEDGSSVQIETFNGVVVGMMALKKGPNTNVRVPLMGPASGEDLIAKLIVNGMVVDATMIEVQR
ncbi:MAG: hypothetical protein AAF683_15310 [Pseudomonadota bacterium]